jgi:NAD(P)-dependent dehydrogenase (short-subunit alcohol dehydrogenase family)
MFYCTKHVLPHMMVAGVGSIINLASNTHRLSPFQASPAIASIGAVRLMTRSDALMYAAMGIRVNSIHPGQIATAPAKPKLAEPRNDNSESLLPIPPHLHLGQPQDVAYGALYLASDESRFVTGTELVIDGGLSAA